MTASGDQPDDEPEGWSFDESDGANESDEPGASSETTGGAESRRATGSDDSQPAPGTETREEADPVDDAGEEADPANDAGEEDGPSLAGILGAEPTEDEHASLRPRIEPERPDPENVIFVLLGAVLSLLVVYRLLTLF